MIRRLAETSKITLNKLIFRVDIAKFYEEPGKKVEKIEKRKPVTVNNQNNEKKD